MKIVNEEREKKTSFVNNVQWAMNNVMKLEGIISLREALNVQRIILQLEF